MMSAFEEEMLSLNKMHILAKIENEKKITDKKLEILEIEKKIKEKELQNLL